MAEKTRVVITGLGTVNPVGLSVKDTWDGILAGRSGISRTTGFDCETYTSQVSGEIKDFDYKQYFSEKTVTKAKRLDRFTHLAVAAAREALQDSGLDLDAVDKRRFGVAIGTGIGGMYVHTREYGNFYNKGHRRLSPFYIPTMIGNMGAGILSIEYGLQGPNFSVQTACASANHALGAAYYAICNGDAEFMLSGGTEAIVEPVTVAGFCNMKALSTQYNDTPETSSRPFDKGRDGFVIAEGSGIFVLERLSDAQARGATIYGEVKSVGMSGDANDMVAPCADGEGAYLAMEATLRKADLSSADVGYINCHGTSTPLGDLAEALAIDRLLKGRYDNVQIGSTKSMTGHMIGAASAVEAIITVLALKEGRVPPNINIFDFDENLPIPSETLAREVRNHPMKAAMSNSFGFGGHNSCALFTQV